MERFFYAFSTLHCLAVSMQDGGAGTGTVMRVDSGLVEVKFRGSISPVWCSPSLLERVA